MKCPFRIKTIKGNRLDKEERIQEFEECYGTSCAAAYIVEYNGTAQVEGCKRLIEGETK